LSSKKKQFPHRNTSTIEILEEKSKPKTKIEEKPQNEPQKELQEEDLEYQYQRQKVLREIEFVKKLISERDQEITQLKKEIQELRSKSSHNLSSFKKNTELFFERNQVGLKSYEAVVPHSRSKSPFQHAAKKFFSHDTPVNSGRNYY